MRRGRKYEGETDRCVFVLALGLGGPIRNPDQTARHQKRRMMEVHRYHLYCLLTLDVGLGRECCRGTLDTGRQRRACGLFLADSGLYLNGRRRRLEAFLSGRLGMFLVDSGLWLDGRRRRLEAFLSGRLGLFLVDSGLWLDGRRRRLEAFLSDRFGLFLVDSGLWLDGIRHGLGLGCRMYIRGGHVRSRRVQAR